MRAIREWLANSDILLAGRYSEWEYYNSDHAFIAGKKAADQVSHRQEARGFLSRQMNLYSPGTGSGGTSIFSS